MAATTLAIEGRDPHSRARWGTLFSPHGYVRTPTLCPQTTHGTVPGLDPDEVRAAGAGILAASALHLAVEPGVDVIDRLGGLSAFTAWRGPMVCVSGATQLFRTESGGPSLGEGDLHGLTTRRQRPRGQPARILGVDDAGLRFTSPIDGSRQAFTPESFTTAQERLGADLAVLLVPPLRKTDAARCSAWVERAFAARSRTDQALLLEWSATDRTSAATGDEAHVAAQLDGVLVQDWCPSALEEPAGLAGLPALPPRAIRCVSGTIGPLAAVEAVAAGADLILTDAASRDARRGIVYTRQGRLVMDPGAARRDWRPIDDDCPCYACTTFSRGYLCHLFAAGELLAGRLATLHNLTFLVRLVDRCRQALREGTLEQVRCTLSGFQTPRDTGE